jgi:hypothetical protein
MLNFLTIQKYIYISKAPPSEHFCPILFQLGRWLYTEEDWNVKHNDNSQKSWNYEGM